MIADIETAMLDAIKAADFGYQLGTVAGYCGELDGNEQGGDQFMGQMALKFPVVWVIFNGDDKVTPVGTANDRWRVDAGFLVIVVARNVRGQQFTRHSANADQEVGAYQIIEDLRLLLLGQDFDLAIARMKPGPIKRLVNKKTAKQAMAAYYLEFKTQYVIAQPYEAYLPDWLRTGFNYYLTPGDDIADASDLLTMRSS